MNKEECGLDATAKEALRDLSHLENYLEESDAPANMKNRAVDVRLCIKELREGVKTIGTQAAANKAAEEGDLPAQDLTVVLRECADALAYIAYDYDGSKLEGLDPRISESTCAAKTALIAERSARAAIAADRASRQVANKAEVECRDDGRCQYAIDHGAEGLGHCPVGKCCMPANPHITTGVISEDLAFQVLTALSYAMVICDAVPTRAHDLASGDLQCIGRLVNNQGGSGLHGYALIRNAETAFRTFLSEVGASTVLTDERCEEIDWDSAVNEAVAAQAGQVAVPDGFCEPCQGFGELHGEVCPHCSDNTWQAAPSPAKESK